MTHSSSEGDCFVNTTALLASVKAGAASVPPAPLAGIVWKGSPSICGSSLGAAALCLHHRNPALDCSLLLSLKRTGPTLPPCSPSLEKVTETC